MRKATTGAQKARLMIGKEVRVKEGFLKGHTGVVTAVNGVVKTAQVQIWNSKEQMGFGMDWRNVEEVWS